MLLEANARPGLAIQIANQEGLLRRLEEAAPATTIAGRIEAEQQPWRKSA
jgi:hypothetical protein